MPKFSGKSSKKLLYKNKKKYIVCYETRLSAIKTQKNLK